MAYHVLNANMAVAGRAAYLAIAKSWEGQKSLISIVRIQQFAELAAELSLRDPKDSAGVEDGLAAHISWPHGIRRSYDGMKFGEVRAGLECGTILLITNVATVVGFPSMSVAVGIKRMWNALLDFARPVGNVISDIQKARVADGVIFVRNKPEN